MHGSFVTAEDYARYTVRDEPPVVTSYRGYTIETTQPPHGGPTLAAILNILEGYDLARLGHNSPDYIHLVSMAMKAAFADRNRLRVAHVSRDVLVNVPTLVFIKFPKCDQELAIDVFGCSTGASHACRSDDHRSH